MRSMIARLSTLAVVLTAVTLIGAADDPLTRAQIARLGKAATALVEVKAARGEGSGSAFCIHKDGWFLTNAHVAQGELTLVLNPSLKTEESYAARVVRSKPELDLALLRVDGVKDLPTLALGSDEGLEELMDVVSFGFPFGQALRAVSVNPGSITALRQKDGSLHRIQLDAVLNPGNSGGPVLDSAGKVIGVVESGIVVGGRAPTGVNFAIPVSLVSRFLERPEVRFEPQRPKPGELHKPMQFEARVTPLLPTGAPLTVDLSLKAGNGPERTARMQADGDLYRLTAVPIPAEAGPHTLRLVARFDNGTLDSTTTERSFTIGGREVDFAEVRRIRPGSPSRVVLRTGETITGALVGLEAVPTRLGEQTLSVDLTSAGELSFTPLGETDPIGYTLVVRQGEREVFRQSDSLVAADFSFTDFGSTSGLKLNGSAFQAGNRLRLTTSTEGQRGSAWFTSQQFVQEGFTTTFVFQITDPKFEAGDGFVFVIQNSPAGISAMGDCGGCLGYAEGTNFAGISNSIAIEFDTVFNGDDPNDNHISVHTNKVGPNHAEESFSLGSTTSIPNLSDGAIHTARITYSGESLAIYIDDSNKANLTISVDLASILSLNAGQAWVGFTSSTGAVSENHDLLSWSFLAAPVPEGPRLPKGE